MFSAWVLDLAVNSRLARRPALHLRTLYVQ